MTRRAYIKPIIGLYRMETDGNLMAASDDTKMEMVWDDDNGGRYADPKSEVLSKEHEGSSGQWDE